MCDNTSGTLWVKYEGAFYDVTGFIERDEHPGGSTILLPYVGEDMTEAFDAIGHSKHARRLLEVMRISDPSSVLSATSVSSSQDDATTTKDHQRPPSFFGPRLRPAIRSQTERSVDATPESSRASGTVDPVLGHGRSEHWFSASFPFQRFRKLWARKEDNRTDTSLRTFVEPISQSNIRVSTEPSCSSPDRRIPESPARASSFSPTIGVSPTPNILHVDDRYKTNARRLSCTTPPGAASPASAAPLSAQSSAHGTVQQRTPEQALDGVQNDAVPFSFHRPVSPRFSPSVITTHDLAVNPATPLIDLRKPIVPQIYNLNKLEYVQLSRQSFSVSTPCLFFDNPLLEIFSRTVWWVVPLVWLPVSFTLFSFFRSYYQKSLTFSLTCFLLGLFAWTFFEYGIHRFIFHFPEESLPDFSVARLVHFLGHGVHHVVPMDRLRLVMPPALFSVFLAIGYSVIALFLPLWVIHCLLPGILVGYVIYDMIHYASHHFFVDWLPFLFFMKRYHMKHHFKQPDKGFGVSTPFWDLVFNTYLA